MLEVAYLPPAMRTRRKRTGPTQPPNWQN